MRRIATFSLVLVFVLLCLSSFPLNANTIALCLSDEGDGQILKDSIGNKYDGKLEGKVGWVEGKFSKIALWVIGRLSCYGFYTNDTYGKCDCFSL
ncbi:MAG: hypothetical protein QG641_489 [Candidatus Poribacteria bacterium]|nr:hypothetical protein [Candidatus Poribacteria bacterium]